MKQIERHPMIMIVAGVLGISLSSIFVKYSQAPSAVTAAWRLLWTVLLMTPVVLGKGTVRNELFHISRKTLLLSGISGVFLAVHFVLWFESLQHTSVASSTTIVCTELPVFEGKIKRPGIGGDCGDVYWKHGNCFFGFIPGRCPAVRRYSSASGCHCCGSLYPDRPDRPKRYLHHCIYLPCIRRLCRSIAAPVLSDGRVSDRVWCRRGDRRIPAGGVFDPSGTQYFQLVSEIFLSVVCFRVKALRAGCGSRFGGYSVWRSAGDFAGCWRCADHRRRILLFPDRTGGTGRITGNMVFNRLLLEF